METECICRLRKIYKAITAFETQVEASLGVNINAMMLLCLLSERENLSAGEIADEMGLTRSNASKVIASLEKSGSIRRHICKEDGRSMRFHLTWQGEELLEHVHCDSLQLPEELRKVVEANE